ncbi:hypothetical protein ABVK25_012474 [Lepraria finkii]|uniref:Uncharacterized protein n=1 Tax=Lepraria finkii TaxID=1340010 RepID=A0ABR4AEA1_9LECA
MDDEKVPHSELPEAVQSHSTVDDDAPPAKVLKHSHDADEAMKAFEGWKERR